MAAPEPALKRRSPRAPWQRGHDDAPTVEALSQLEDAGFEILHDVDTGYDAIDHVVVGPTGAFAIEIPGWTGEVHTKRGHLYCGFHDEERTRRRAIWSAACLEQWLDEDGVDIPVAALLAPADAHVAGDRIELPYLAVLPLASLPSFIGDAPKVLAANQIARAVRVIAAHAAAEPATSF
jgi:hypothetical protein